MKFLKGPGGAKSAPQKARFTYLAVLSAVFVADSGMDGVVHAVHLIYLILIYLGAVGDAILLPYFYKIFKKYI